jgi:hypothetical protein
MYEMYLAMISATGFLAVSRPFSALDGDRQLTGRFPGASVSSMRAQPDDCRSVADNPGLVSPNVGPRPLTVSPIVGQKIAMISGQSADNLKPLVRRETGKE